MRRPTSGRVLVGEVDVTGAGPAEVMAAGVGRIPEDRHASLVLDLSVALNLVLEHIDDFRTASGLDERRIEAHARALIDRFAIRARPSDRVGTLSGGNIQKVLLARVLSREPRVIVISQPTRGLDVGATEYVRGEISRVGPPARPSCSSPRTSTSSSRSPTGSSSSTRAGSSGGWRSATPIPSASGCSWLAGSSPREDRAVARRMSRVNTHASRAGPSTG